MKLELYCTVGRGLLPLCTEELKQLGIHVSHSIEGKIFFTISKKEQCPQLKSAERLLVCAYHGYLTNDITNKAATAFKLQRLLAEQINWSDHIRTWRLFHPDAPSGPLPFRANVRLSGQFRRILQPLRVSRSFGQRVASTEGHVLQPCVRNPIVVIDIHVSDEHVTVGIALTGLCSPALGGASHGLRSTTASAMVICLGPLPPASVILDPMCGKGSLLYEVPEHCFKIGIDIDESQLLQAKQNVRTSNLIFGDARNMPLKSKSIDHVVCDLPFGLQYSSLSELETLLPSVLLEIKRVIKHSATIVLLTSMEQLPFLTKCINNTWSCKNKFPISLGALEAVISVYSNI
ncbi:hypothetical protein B566_EDAN001592 [Ephemera danica]|nr:hypothetical protein B566_EDAN001592 [Ephemera danica]